MDTQAVNVLTAIPHSLAEAKNFIKCCVAYLGRGFNPDTDFSEYTTDRNYRSETMYSTENAVLANEALAAAIEEFEMADEDIYEFCADQL